MRQNAPNILLFLGLTALAAGIFWGADQIWPPKPKPLVPLKPLTKVRDADAAVAGAALFAYDPPRVEPPKPVAPPKPVEVKSHEPRSLIALGDDSFYLKVLLTNLGGGVQQVVLTQFDEASRLGLEFKQPDGKVRPLHLIPGYQRPWKPYLAEEPPYIALSANYSAAEFNAKQKPRKFDFEEPMLTRPSYVLLHYPSRDDPSRAADDADADNFPFATLGERMWEVESIDQPAGGTWKVVFVTRLDAPYFLTIRKTFTLAPKDYDFKMTVEIVAQEEHTRKAGQFRYQIVGPLGMPIEGEWYTTTYRTAFTGWTDGDSKPRRAVDDPATIHIKAGADKIPRRGTFHYAAVGTQYFASALAIDSDVNEQNQPWEYVRATRELLPAEAKINGVEYDSEKTFIYDITIRAVSTLLDPAPGEKIVHQYAVYNGPIKVRLLKQLEGERAVSHELVDRYLHRYHLETLTDYHSPHFFGRFANAIYWADLVIWATNVMHSLLGFLYGILGNWGLSIAFTTMLVKLCLILPSRRQQAINVNMQARIKTIKPELDEIAAKYGDNYMQLQQEKAKLFRKAGIKHSAQFGGCLLLFAQMPILMGLYFCLQESIFFRLTPFLWMQNLAAPDMLVWWSEHIPFISSPSGRFGSFSFLYLGPYFNILPMAAVVLFYVQQKLTMPPPTDPQMEMQAKMMKYMLIVSALFFYKVASGLCVYFIVSGLWSLIERRLVPKPKVDEEAVRKSLTEPEAKPKGWLARKLADAKERMEELQKQSENQRQIRNEPKPGTEPQTRNERRSQKKKKK